MSKFPTWKYILLIVVSVIGLLYSAPNLFGQDPSIQISGAEGNKATQATIDQVKTVLHDAKLQYKEAEIEGPNLVLFRFADTDTQLQAKDVIHASLGGKYTVALNLASKTPAWLERIGAEPMKLGLDLRGGVHFLLEVDVASVVDKQLKGDVRTMGTALRKERIRYQGVKLSRDQAIRIHFTNNDNRLKAFSFLKRRYPDYLFTKIIIQNRFMLVARMSTASLTKIQQYAVEQTMTVLRNRINELGIAEPVVQQQGKNRIVVDLPGIQDAAEAKEILGGTATLEFHLVDEEHDVRTALEGSTPFGTRVYRMSGDVPILLKNQIVLAGSSIVSAQANFGQDGSPAVNIRIAGPGVAYFGRITRQNVNKRMAIVYVEDKTDTKLVDGKVVRTQRRIEKVISAPVIRSALPAEFQITGIGNIEEGRKLALLLRAGALPANIYPVEQSMVGPSLGKQNVDKGIMSVQVGFIIIVIFMFAYYRLFGLIANLALAFNLFLLVAILSMLGATLTLPGIAGIVLTVGMAVDANVLIFERIREELRNGMSPIASIQAGYEKAFSTIVDANVTTLIVAIVLFALGSGSVKGFAVTLTIGLLTSMFTAITGTRAIVSLIYNKRGIKKLSIGI